MKCLKTSPGKIALFFGLVIPAISSVLYFNGLLQRFHQPVYLRDQGTKLNNVHRTVHQNASSLATNETTNRSPNATATKLDNSAKNYHNYSFDAHGSNGTFKSDVVESNKTLNSAVKEKETLVKHEEGVEIKVLKKEKHVVKDIIDRDLRGYVSIFNQSESLQMNCSQCAYVSSSGRLLGSRSGHLIDSFPCVIRMNDARINGFEEDVGNRTTVRVVAHNAISGVQRISKTLLPGTNAVILWGPARSMDTKRKTSSFNVAKATATDMANFAVKFYYLTENQYDFADYIFEHETGKNRYKSHTWLTTGWFTMLFARAVCGEIHVFGMVSEHHCRNEPNSTVPYHYYSPSGRKECSTYQRSEGPRVKGHHYMTEKSIFARWSQREPKIFFHHPDWSV